MGSQGGCESVRGSRAAFCGHVCGRRAAGPRAAMRTMRRRGTKREDGVGRGRVPALVRPLDDAGAALDDDGGSADGGRRRQRLAVPAGRGRATATVERPAETTVQGQGLCDGSKKKKKKTLR
eukprot:NODE_7034_length_422_cov_26.777480_g5412_i0.p2 GENE.NODE_7034_length_422_cov_26.777480_g5412_i0~~NODE_7034_length_422_cov_26.777480_g5412_i0.p2  ORF type:complete len:122 (-),score=24.77 NODE_7034_length_422_cov_26.777480_g5412_i0:5-370(-)